MRRAWRTVLVLAIALAVSSLSARAQVVAQSRRDCRLADRRYDSGWHMRRYELHAVHAGASIAVAELLHRGARLPRWASALTATVFIGIIPHVTGGIILRNYPINPMDWAFDAFNASASLLLWRGLHDGWRPKVEAAAAEVAGYAALACWASP